MHGARFLTGMILALTATATANAAVKSRLSILVDSSGSMLTTAEIVTVPESCVALAWNGCTATGNPTTAQESCNACMSWTIRQDPLCATSFDSGCRTTYGSCWRFFSGASAPACGQVLGVTAGVPTRGDGTALTPGCDVDGDGAANDSRLFTVKEALGDAVADAGAVELALWRYAQIEGGQACADDASCPDTPSGASHLTCETSGGAATCAFHAASLGGADGQCAPLTWNGAAASFSCASCSDAGTERLTCEAYGLERIRTGGASPLVGTVDCALPTADHPLLASHGAVSSGGGCEPAGAEQLVAFPPTALDDNRTEILAWLDHENAGGAAELVAHGAGPLAAALRDLRAAVYESARLDTETPCRPHRVIVIADGPDACEPAAAAVTAAGTFQDMAFTNGAGVAVTDYDVPVHVLAFAVCPPAQPSCQARQDLDLIAAAGGTSAALVVSSQFELQQALTQLAADAEQGAAACNGVCGDGVLDPGEGCDDGNTTDGDCCSSACALEPATSVCRAAAGACDLAETCTGTSATCPADTGAPDGDADGLCDALDPCTGGAVVAAPQLKMANFLTAAGDDALTFAGTMPHAVVLGFDPLLTGVRVIATDGDGPLVDAAVPAGAYDKTTKTGWKTNRARTSWSFKSPVPLGGAVSKVTVARTKKAVKFKVSGTKGAFAVPPLTLPLRATLVLDPPSATTGNCAESELTSAQCAFNRSQKKLTCK